MHSFAQREGTDLPWTPSTVTLCGSTMSMSLVLLDIGGSTLRQPPEETYKRNGFGCFDQSEERFLLVNGPPVVAVILVFAAFQFQSELY